MTTFGHTPPKKTVHSIMSDPISYTGLLTAIFLPWITGAIWLRYFFRHSKNWNWPFILGYGNLVGIFFTTLIIRFWDAVGVQLSFFTLAGVIAIITLAGYLALLQSKNITPSANTLSAEDSAPHRWQKIIISLLFALIIIRYGTILLEIIWRPLYSWDAWMNWTIKAKTWVLTGGISDYISPNAWLSQPENLNAYTLGNLKAWKYPETVPLIQYWTASGIGHWNESLINLPWLTCAISLGMAFYGQARLQHMSALSATIGVYLVMNLPYINVHTALAGYADLWLMATFSMSAFSLANWQTTHDRQHLYIAIILAILCSQLKLPGIIFTAILILALLIYSIKNAKLLVTSSAFIAILVAIIITTGIDIDIAGFGKLVINSENISIPTFGDYSIKYYSTWDAIKRTLFSSSNWNILFSAVAIIIISRIFLYDRIHRPTLILTILIEVTVLYFFLFFFTDYHYVALDQTTLNRVIVYTIPIILWYLIQLSQNAAWGNRPALNNYLLKDY